MTQACKLLPNQYASQPRHSLRHAVCSEHPAKLLLVLGTTSDNKQICGTVPRNTIFANGTGFVAPLPSCAPRHL